MNPADLRTALESLRSQNLLPMAIVATAGTTDFGSIDPLPEIAATAHETGAWLHVDAAYGGALLFSPQHRSRLAGIEAADSLSIDFHKLFWQPIPCSIFLLRDARNFEHIKMHADYLNPESHEEAGIPDLVTTSLLTSRRFDALKLWISFESVGRNQLAEMIERTVARNRQMLMSLMIAAFAFKLVFFGVYVVLMLRVVGLRPAPFVLSLTGYFSGLYLVEALYLRRLFR